MTERLVVVQRLVAGWSALWLAIRMPHHLDLTELPDARWRPVGMFAPLDRPPAPWFVTLVLLAAVVASVAAAIGWRPRLVLPLWAGAVLFATTWASSWGQLFHTENLLALHALLLAGGVLVRLADPASILKAMVVVTVTAYVVSGVAKLRGSGLDWVTGDVLRDQVGYDNLRKAVVGGSTSPIGTRLVDQSWLWPPLAALALAVELGAPVALLGRRWATRWVAAAWSFHVGVFAMMAITFPYQLALVAFAPMLPVERLTPRLRRLRPNAPAPVGSDA